VGIIERKMRRVLRRVVVSSVEEVSRKASERGHRLSSTREYLFLSLVCKAGVVIVRTSTCFSTPERTWHEQLTLHTYLSLSLSLSSPPPKHYNPAAALCSDAAQSLGNKGFAINKI
jgi:hypothetical protein